MRSAPTVAAGTISLDLPFESVSTWDFYHWHAGLEYAYQLLVECLLMRDRDGNPRGMCIIGESRAGKTSFLANAKARLRREHPELASGLYIAQPPIESRDVDSAIRQRELEGANSPNAVLHPHGKILKALSDKIWPACTAFVWEEAHQFYLEKTSHFRMQSAAFFRLRMNETKKPIVFVGTEVLHEYIHLSSELKNRFRATAEIGRYSLATDADEEVFRGLLRELEEALPLTVMPSLLEQHMMLRVFCACNGLTGDLMDLMERAVKRAELTSFSIIHPEELADAFATEFPERAVVLNPFEEGVRDDDVVKAIAEQARRMNAARPKAVRRGRNSS